MTCPLHTAPQFWCRECMPSTIGPGIDPEVRAVFTKIPLTPEQVRGLSTNGRSLPSPHVHVHGDSRALPSPRLDASAARIAGLEANVNEKLATIAALHDEIAQLRSVESVAIAAARLAAAHDKLRKVLAIVARIGGYMSHEDQQTMGDARAEVA